MTSVTTLIKQDNVGLVVLNNPPVNALSHRTRVELVDAFTSALADPLVEVIILCCEGRTFVAGADIKEFGKPPLLPDVPDVIDLLDGSPKLTIAAIHGAALGGGLELALACHYRVSASGAKLGLPEVTLGILPGAGGTQRLPRLIGARAALDMIAFGAPVGAEQAHALGLVDAIIHGELRTGAIAFAKRLVAEGGAPRRLSDAPPPPVQSELLDHYEADVRDRFRGFRAPMACVEAVRAAVGLPFAEGKKRERELFLELMASPESRAQRHVFFAEREVHRVPGVAAGTATRPITSAVVLGAAGSGTRIALELADAGIVVDLLGSSGDELERGLALVRRHYAAAVSAGRISADEMAERLARIRPAVSYDAATTVDLALEATDDDVESMRGRFVELARHCKAGAILAASAVSVDLDELAAATGRPADVVGLCFVSPAHGAGLLECARGRLTAPEVWASAMKLGKTLGRIPVPVTAKPGFVSKRTRDRQIREAICLVAEGAAPEQVDRVFFDFGFPSGPFADGGAAIDALLSEARAKAPAGAARVVPDQEILERCLYAVVNEAAHILEEGVVGRALDVDMVWVHGYRFPAYRGGPLFYADQVGTARILDAVLAFERRLGSALWAPAPLLARLAAEGKGFHASA